MVEHVLAKDETGVRFSLPAPVKPYCYLDGKIVPLAKARLSLSDLGVLRGYGVFDFLRTYNGKPFYFHEHFARFKRSADIIGLNVPVGEVMVRDLITKLCRKNRVADASIRMVLTGGETKDGFGMTSPSFFILMEDLYQFSESVFTKGAKIITHEYERSFPRAKTTNYSTALALKTKKERAGAVEILYTKNKLVLEASTSNIFLVKNGRISTPEDGVLHGITRGIVLALTRELGIPHACRPVRVSELAIADEVFLTATNKDVTPIVSIDGKKVGKGTVGPVTKQLLTAYRALTRTY